MCKISFFCFRPYALSSDYRTQARVVKPSPNRADRNFHCTLTTVEVPTILWGTLFLWHVRRL